MPHRTVFGEDILSVLARIEAGAGIFVGGRYEEEGTTLGYLHFELNEYGTT